jgi:hypothetical protein
MMPCNLIARVLQNVSTYLPGCKVSHLKDHNLKNFIFIFWLSLVNTSFEGSQTSSEHWINPSKILTEKHDAVWPCSRHNGIIMLIAKTLWTDRSVSIATEWFQAYTWNMIPQKKLKCHLLHQKLLKLSTVSVLIMVPYRFHSQHKCGWVYVYNVWSSHVTDFILVCVCISQMFLYISRTDS